MLHIKDICQKHTQLKNSKLQHFSLWNKLTSDVTPIDLMVYVKSLQIEDEYKQAIRDVEQLQHATIMAMLEGKLRHAPYLAYHGERIVMTMGDFSAAIQFSELSLPRKRAILFILETGMKAEEVIRLTWKMANKMQLTPFAREIVSAMPRSLKINYVFWEDMPSFDMMAPLIGLTDNFVEMFAGLSHREVVNLYENAVLIDSIEESKHFVQQVFKTAGKS